MPKVRLIYHKCPGIWVPRVGEGPHSILGQMVGHVDVSPLDGIGDLTAPAQAPPRSHDLKLRFIFTITVNCGLTPVKL